MSLILTLDAGTTGLKCSAFTEKGELVKAYTASYQTYFPEAGWAQQKPAEQLKAAITAIRETISVTGTNDLVAMVFDGTMNGCIPIDQNGNALYDNIIHSDTRTSAQVNTINSLIPIKDYYGICGIRPDVRSGFPKYIWLKENEPEVYKKAYKFVNIKDFLYGQATGNIGCTDFSDASLCNCLDMSKGDWAWEIIRTCGIDTEKMPRLLNSCDASATVSAEFARLTGLPQGLPVAVGGGDGSCAARGAIVSHKAKSYMNIGSTAWISVNSSVPVFDEDMRIYNYYDLDSKSFNVTGTIQSAAAAFNWAVQNILCPGQEHVDYDLLAEKAASVKPGSDGIMFLPMLMGERTPWWTVKSSGTFIGMMQHHTQAHIIRSVYEGIMQSLAICGDVFRENQLPVTGMTLVGGGAKSAFWVQMAADMFGIPVWVHKTPHQGTSLGAAFAAGIGVGLYKDFDDASKHIQIQEQVNPNSENTEFYSKHRSVYAKLYPNMIHAYETLYHYRDSINK